MAVKKRGLGRGLDALLNPSVSGRGGGHNDGTLRKLPVETLTRSPFQPRRTIDEESLRELADSIRSQGLIQPLVVRAVLGGRYEIIAGERRWRAAQMAGLGEVPALIREVSDQVAMAMALIENIQRENLDPLEEAQALQRLHSECGLTHQQVAEAVGRSRTAVSNLLRLLELSPPVRELLSGQRLEMGHARALLGLDPALQHEAAQQVVLRGLSVRETEALVRRLQEDNGRARPRSGPLDPDIRALQDDLSQRLGARVSVRQGQSGSGRVVIQYNSLDELDGILAHIK
ncbi:MAG: ParB/RepB/Spo0J family partition protein [Candidatus Competibacterales bacterium]|nr:ParB/RepB/Spo0J family partition protein [Candidatus Competibacterales bacterium]